MSLKTDNGRQFVSDEFESYLNECGIEHRTSPPIWPQANGEIERQNRTMLKSMKFAHAQGKDWKIELYKSLLAYRTTPQETTGVSPSKLMIGREIRTKLPELIEEKKEKDITVRDRDAEKKQSGKDYADHKRNAKENEIMIGDHVLMQQNKENKLSTRFGERPLKVVKRVGSEAVVETDDGKQYRRNTAHLRKFTHNASVGNTNNDIKLRK